MTQKISSISHESQWKVLEPQVNGVMQSMGELQDERCNNENVNSNYIM